MKLPAFMDLEASGFGSHSYPIEIGAVLEDGRTLCFLIKPSPHWTHWDKSAAAIHGITQELLEKHGKSQRIIAETLNQELAGKTLYSDGWNHDYSWLHKLYDEAELYPSFKLESVLTLLNEQSMALWDEAKDKVIKTMKLQRHRASSDALILQNTYAAVSALTLL